MRYFVGFTCTVRRHPPGKRPQVFHSDKVCWLEFTVTWSVWVSGVCLFAKHLEGEIWADHLHHVLFAVPVHYHEAVLRSSFSLIDKQCSSDLRGFILDTKDSNQANAPSFEPSLRLRSSCWHICRVEPVLQFVWHKTQVVFYKTSSYTSHKK